MSLADYQNRTIDYAILHATTPADLAMFNAAAQSEVLTGLYKLVQRFLLLLLTRLGSVPYDLAYGSTFMLDGAFGWRTALDVEQSFTLALTDIRRQLGAIAVAGDPADERFAAATLTKIQLSRKVVQLTMRIVSQAGSSVVVIAPVTVLPQG